MTKCRLGLNDFRRMKAEGERIAMLTAYTTWQARLAENAGAEMLLVGDSVGMVEHGLPDTLGVTIEMMVLHCAAVSRGSKEAFIIGDMPFMSYEADERDAILNAGRLVREGKVQAVKLEGGTSRIETIRAIVRAGIPVMGHVGLTPQSSISLGGFKVQGKDSAGARRVLDDALAVAEAELSRLSWNVYRLFWPKRLRTGCPFRRSASERVLLAMDRSWSFTTFSTSMEPFAQNSPKSSPKVRKQSRKGLSVTSGRSNREISRVKNILSRLTPPFSRN